MKNLFITIALLLFLSINAQENVKYKVIGKEIIKEKPIKKAPIKTDLTYTIKDTTYPVYQGTKGGYYILRVSKKTGKEYKMYLPTK
jgi:hypothetical protein